VRNTEAYNAHYSPSLRVLYLRIIGVLQVIQTQRTSSKRRPYISQSEEEESMDSGRRQRWFNSDSELR
jgi:hypothetical protein